MYGKNKKNLKSVHGAHCMRRVCTDNFFSKILAPSFFAPCTHTHTHTHFLFLSLPPPPHTHTHTTTGGRGCSSVTAGGYGWRTAVGLAGHISLPRGVRGHFLDMGRRA